MNREKGVAAALLFLLAAAAFCAAQETTEKPRIEAKKGFLYRYTYQSRPLYGWKDFYLIMADSPDALARAQKARKTRVQSDVLGGAGAALLCLPILLLPVTEQNPLGLMGLGGGLMVVGGAFRITAGRQLKSAVDSYNQSLSAIDDAGIGIVLAPKGLFVSWKL